jgi:hypothetical protein
MLVGKIPIQEAVSKREGNGKLKSVIFDAMSVIGEFDVDL